MQRIVRIISVGVVFASALTACGGSAGRSTVPQPKQAAQNQVRHVRSIPCTPDSQGYCAVLVSSSRHGSVSCIYGQSSWEIYGTPDVDYGTYNYNWSQCPTFFYDWEPDEPSVAFSDGNLP